MNRWIAGVLLVCCFVSVFSVTALACDDCIPGVTTIEFPEEYNGGISTFAVSKTWPCYINRTISMSNNGLTPTIYYKQLSSVSEPIKSVTFTVNEDAASGSEYINSGQQITYSGDSPLIRITTSATSIGETAAVYSMLIDHIDLYGVVAANEHNSSTYTYLGQMKAGDYSVGYSSDNMQVNTIRFYGSMNAPVNIWSDRFRVVVHFVTPIPNTSSKYYLCLGKPTTWMTFLGKEAGTGEVVNNAAQTIIDSLSPELQQNTQVLELIRNYVQLIYDWMHTPYVAPDGHTVSYDWNEFAYLFSNLYLNLAKFMDPITGTYVHTQDAIKQSVLQIYDALGFTSQDTFAAALEIHISSIVTAIENQTTEIIDYFESIYGEGGTFDQVDKGSLNQGAADNNQAIQDSDAIEKGIYESMDSSLASIDISAAKVGSQTLTALSVVLPYCNAFFNVLGEVGMVLIFSLACGIVLLLIGRGASAVVSKNERANRAAARASRNSSKGSG